MLAYYLISCEIKSIILCVINIMKKKMNTSHGTNNISMDWATKGNKINEISLLVDKLIHISGVRVSIPIFVVYYMIYYVYVIYFYMHIAISIV